MNPSTLLLLLSWLIPSSPLGAGPPSPTEEKIDIVRLSGEEVSPSFIEILSPGVVALTDGEGRTEIPLENLRSITFTGREASPLAGTALFLAGGGVLAGEVLSADGEKIKFGSPLIDETSISLASIRAIRITPVSIDTTAFQRQMEKKKPNDTVFVIQEKKLLRVPGGFRFLNREKLSFVWEGQEKTLPREKIHGIVLSGGSVGRGARTARVLLTDGSRFEGEPVAMDRAALTMRLMDSSRLVIARGSVVRIEILSDRLVYLSDLEPIKVREVPYFNTIWPYRKDRSLDGNPIRLGGEVYEKGLGVHSRCLLTYELDGEYESFSAVIGIDDETEDLGHVIFRVRADGEVVFESGGISGVDKPRRIQLDLKGKQRLVLEVDFGEDLDIGDHADWADAHLVRKS
ncbi:MAG: NPCBM/NEW2 domain-containing protein [Planctomycetota bacterium]|nr:NPCBM/NEW2 domain-containing protein [Planctomycetota bacterium]